MGPLMGDSEGRYKVQITGNSGTGKSTTGTALAALLGVPYIALDQLFWEPGWKETPEEAFRAKIRAAMSQSERGWVIDGGYQRKGAGFIAQESTDIIWLDPPLVQYFPRILIRTILRLLGRRPTCSRDCPESFREAFFSTEGILWWCLSQHRVNRRRGREQMIEMSVYDGTKARKMRRFGGWGSDLKRWMEEVAEMCRAKQKTA